MYRDIEGVYLRNLKGNLFQEKQGNRWNLSINRDERLVEVTVRKITRSDLLAL